MDWGKVGKKALTGLGLVVVAVLTGNVETLQNFIVGFIPEAYQQLTLTGLVGAGISALTNWWKHKND